MNHIRSRRDRAGPTSKASPAQPPPDYEPNVGALSTRLQPGDTVIVDSGDHASIMDGIAMSHARIRPFRHNRLARLEELLDRAAGDGGGVLVVVDGVYSMEGDVCDLQTIVPLAKR